MLPAICVWFGGCLAHVCSSACVSECAPALPAQWSGWLEPWPGIQALGPVPGPTTSHSTFDGPLDMPGEVIPSLGSLGPLKIKSLQDFTKSGANGPFPLSGSPRVNAAIVDNELRRSPSSFVLSRNWHSWVTLIDEDRDKFLLNKCRALTKGLPRGGCVAVKQ